VKFASWNSLRSSNISNLISESRNGLSGDQLFHPFHCSTSSNIVAASCPKDRKQKKTLLSKLAQLVNWDKQQSDLSFSNLEFNHSYW